MMFTLYSADYVGAPGNCSYPHKVEVTDTATFADAVKKDYVCAEYMNSYRNTFNLSYSGSTVTLAYKGRSGSGQILKVFGVN